MSHLLRIPHPPRAKDAKQLIDAALRAMLSAGEFDKVSRKQSPTASLISIGFSASPPKRL